MIARRWRLLLGLVAALVLGVWLFYPDLTWDGEHHCRVEFVVLDARSEQPIGNATVSLIRTLNQSVSAPASNNTSAVSSAPYMWRADSAGRATFVIGAPAGGSSNLFGLTGTFRLYGSVKIEAPGYAPYQTSFVELDGNKAYALSTPQPVRFTVHLTPNERR